MYTAVDFKQAYADYMQYNRELMKSQTPGSRILGFLGFAGARPGNDPGHQKFYEEMKTALNAVCEEHPDPQTAAEIIDVIFRARDLYADENMSAIMLIAIEGLTCPLISFLSPEKAKERYDSYNAANPKSKRLPVQKDIIAALKKAAGI